MLCALPCLRRFIRRAVEMQHQFVADVTPDQQISEVLAWLEARTPAEVSLRLPRRLLLAHVRVCVSGTGAQGGSDFTHRAHWQGTSCERGMHAVVGRS